MKKILLSFIVFISFFIPSLLTLDNYGISWDEPTHFKRGQGYLWYLLTGDNDYNKLPPYDLVLAQNDSTYHERSIYQDDKHNAAFYRTIDGTHPPLADILSSATNMLFYQKLGILGDIESYHIFEIFVAGIGVAVLFLFVYESFGIVAALISAVLFATYPLFWAESHFNIKDPVETSWIILTLYFLWNGVRKSSALFIFISSIFAGFALGTKFNVIFLPFIVIPWLTFVFKMHRQEFINFLKRKGTIFAFVLYPIVMLAIFYVSYPFLWDNPIAGLGKVLTYYQRNALDPAFANAVLPNWPFYAFRWIVLTAPPLVLLGFLLNIAYLKNNLAKSYGFLLLVYLWLMVTVIRVTIPGINIYGGVRQIMEYIPAIAILAGVGIWHTLSKLKNFKFPISNFQFQIVSIVLILALSILPLVRLHPNENVYFNFLAGGLMGAVKSGVPAAGNSFGNAYYQAVKWLNANAHSNATLTLFQGSTLDIPKNKLRSDINLSGDYFSGVGRQGEYIVALIYNREHKENFYAWEYVDRFLEPVYEVRVDDVPILKIWKNDLEHTKPEYKLREIKVEDVVLNNEDNKLEIKLKEEFLLSRIIFTLPQEGNCSPPAGSAVETSLNGKDWVREKDPLVFSQVGKKESTFKPAWENSTPEISFSNNLITFYFAGKRANSIRLNLDSEKSCLLISNPTVEIRALIKP